MLKPGLLLPTGEKATMPPKSHFIELPPLLPIFPRTTSQSPASAINQLNFCARRVSARWRGLRRSGRGVVELGGRQPGAAWRRRLETSGASSSFLQAPKERSSSCWRLRLLHPSPASPPPLRHRLLLVGRLEMELRRRRL